MLYKLKIINRTNSKYREFDSFEPDIIVYEAKSIHVEQKLPSEPPLGITYNFCPSGYITKDRDLNYCVMYTLWKHVNNYCHWTLSELPLIYLALDSNSENVVIPDVLLNGKYPFHIRWWEFLNKKFAHKNIIPLSEITNNINGILPVNHDMSSSKKMIGKCLYKHYHNRRATPFCIDLYSKLRNEFPVHENLNTPNFYINRKNRRLENEIEVQNYLIDNGFRIVSLEDFTLDQQVELFSNAKFVIGFHGAGLANLVFSNEKISVIEIVDIDCVHPSYKDGVLIPGKKSPRTYFHVLCHMKNLNYSCLESEYYFLNIDKLRDLIIEMKTNIK